MGKAKGKKGKRGQESDDDDDYVDPIKAAMAAAGGDGDDEPAGMATKKGNKKKGKGKKGAESDDDEPPVSEGDVDAAAYGDPRDAADALYGARILRKAEALDRPVEQYRCSLADGCVRFPRQPRFYAQRETLRSDEDVDIFVDLRAGQG